MPALAAGLDTIRARALHRTLVALGRVDPGRLRSTWPPSSAVILDTVLGAQADAGGLVEAHLAERLAESTGVGGWDLSGLARGPLARESFAARLAVTPDLAARRLAAGATAAESFAPSSSWAMSVAGSVAHDTARRGTAEAATTHPAFSGWRWIPESGACPWCRMQASRGAVFHIDVKHSHGHCRCHVDEVTDRAEAARIRRDGQAAWAAQRRAGDVPSGLDDPLRRHRATMPGAGTPERSAVIDAQIAAYERALPHLAPAGRAAHWQTDRLAALRSERAAVSLLPAVARLALTMGGMGSAVPFIAPPVHPDGVPSMGHSRDLPESQDVPAADLHPDSATATGPGSPMSVRLDGEPTSAAGYARMWATIPTSQWGAADLGLAVRLPDRRIVWLFGDTVSAANGFVHSTAVTQTGGDLHVSAGGTQLLPNESDRVVYWITGATVVDRATLRVTAAQMRLGAASSWDFARTRADDRVATVTVAPSGDLSFGGWSGWTHVPEWPAPMHIVGPHHFTYAHRVHRSLPLGGGYYLTTDAQNWDDDVANHRNPDGSLRYADYALIFGRARLH